MWRGEGLGCGGGKKVRVFTTVNITVFLATANPAQVEVTKCTVPPKKTCHGLSRQKVRYVIEVSIFCTCLVSDLNSNSMFWVSDADILTFTCCIGYLMLTS